MHLEYNSTIKCQANLIPIMPHVSGAVFESPYGYVLIKVKCPFCNSFHIHGYNAPGVRMSHCQESARYYFILEG